MGVVTAPGVYNFSNVLASWAYQRSLGVTPVVELSFMPAVLAGCSWTDPAGQRPGHSPKTVNPGKPPCKNTGMKYKGIEQVPTNWNDWYDLVKALAQAAVDAYGVEEIRTWSFECWNVRYHLSAHPLMLLRQTGLLTCLFLRNCGVSEDGRTSSRECDLFGAVAPRRCILLLTTALSIGMPFPGTYMTLYNASSHAIKSVDSQLKVGGPATAQLLDVKEFHDLATKMNAPFDFVSTHMYPTDPQLGKGAAWNPSDLTNHVKAARASVPDTPFFLSEFTARCVVLVSLLSLATCQN